MLIIGVFRERIRTGDPVGLLTQAKMPPGETGLHFLGWHTAGLVFGEETWWIDENDEGLSSGRCVSLTGLSASSKV